MGTENCCPATKHATPTLRKPSEHERRDDKAKPVTAALVDQAVERRVVGDMSAFVRESVRRAVRQVC
jgi:hypothetical protein